MELAVLPSGVYSLYKLLKEFEEKQGSKKLAADLKANPQIFIELLKKLNKRFVFENQSFRGDWSIDNFPKFMEALRLTSFQRNILRILVDTPNAVSLEQLKERVEKNSNIVISNGSQIGGCIAGITKKCDSQGVPRCVNIQNLGIGMYKYSISFDAKLREALNKFLLEADAFDKEMSVTTTGKSKTRVSKNKS